MDYVEILTVEGCRESGDDIFLMPDFASPDGQWKNRMAKVVVEKPNGEKIEALCRLSVSNFRYADRTVPLDRGYRVLIWFQNKTTEFVPVGSKIHVRPELKEALLPRKTKAQN